MLGAFLHSTSMDPIHFLLPLLRLLLIIVNNVLFPQALSGGRMNYRHFETIRFAMMRKLDVKKMFAVWRVDPPWLPVTKKVNI